LARCYIEIDPSSLDRIHNGIKKTGNGDPFCKYQVYLALMKKGKNGHRTRIYRIP
jgi:hypothetical protein